MKITVRIEDCEVTIENGDDEPILSRITGIIKEAKEACIVLHKQKSADFLQEESCK